MPFSDLPVRLRDVRARIDAAVHRGGHGQTVAIVAVTKTHGPEAVRAAFDAGLAIVGENRVQEAVPKMESVAVPVHWHLIGHLQRNKVKALARFDLFHALDSTRLGDAVNDFALEAGSVIDALIQVNVVGEETKGGFERPEWEAEAARLRGMPGVRVRGVMTMAPLDADERTLRKVFGGARDARDIFRSVGHDATHLSMGMSHDFEVAVEEGATLVRLGTILFGARAP